MKHLGEEQLIDVLMGETPDQDHLAHLGSCAPCSDRLTTLEMGLNAVKRVKPTMPLTGVPVISYDKFARSRKAARTTWLAVAAMLLLALTGLRVQVGGEGLLIQFALFNGNSGVNEARVAELERQLAVVTEMTDEHIEARFNALLLDVDQEMGEYSRVLHSNLTQSDLKNEQALLALQKVWENQRREDRVRGSLR